MQRLIDLDVIKNVAGDKISHQKNQMKNTSYSVNLFDRAYLVFYAQLFYL